MNLLKRRNKLYCARMVVAAFFVTGKKKKLETTQMFSNKKGLD